MQNMSDNKIKSIGLLLTIAVVFTVFLPVRHVSAADRCEYASGGPDVPGGPDCRLTCDDPTEAPIYNTNCTSVAGRCSILDSLANCTGVPTIVSISPNSITAGSADFTLTVYGTNFREVPFLGNPNGGVLYWNGLPRPTVVISPTQINATISAADVVVQGNNTVKVSKSFQNLHTPIQRLNSNSVNFTVTAPCIADGAFLGTCNSGGGGSSGSGCALSCTFLNRAACCSGVASESGRAQDFCGAGADRVSFTCAPVDRPPVISLFPSTLSFESSCTGPPAYDQGYGNIIAWSDTPGTYANVPIIVTGFNCADADCTTGSAINEETLYVTLTVNSPSRPTLSVTLGANPQSGPSPLTTNLSASVGGTAVGSINYSFWWNCTDARTDVSAVAGVCGALPAPSPGSCVTNANGAKCDAISAPPPQTITHTYDATRSYTPKVIVERDGAQPAESRTTVTVNNPSPHINSIDPQSRVAGGPAFTLNVNGTGFIRSSVVRWGGADRRTTFGSSNLLTAEIPASDIATVGTRLVTVFNPAPGGGTSNGVNFTVVSSPACTFTANPDRIVIPPSTSSTLRWSCRSGTFSSCSLSSNPSQPGLPRSVNPDGGEYVVSPARSTTYTLSCRDGRSQSFEARIRVFSSSRQEEIIGTQP